MSRITERVEEKDGVWEIQRDADTQEIVCKVLVEPSPEFLKADRIVTLEAKLPDADRVIEAVLAAERATLEELRAIVVALVKKDLGYDEAVAVRAEYEEATKDVVDGPVDDDPRDPDAEEPIPVEPRSR